METQPWSSYGLHSEMGGLIHSESPAATSGAPCDTDEPTSVFVYVPTVVGGPFVKGRGSLALLEGHVQTPKGVCARTRNTSLPGRQEGLVEELELLKDIPGTAWDMTCERDGA